MLGLNPDTMRKARCFAGARGYSTEELRALCEQISLQADSAGAIFGKTHLIRMLSVPKKKRPSFQRRAIAEGWSFARLEQEVVAHFGWRRQGGKRPTIPRDVGGMLVQLEQMCRAWERWVTLVEARAADDEEAKAGLQDLPTPVAKMLKRITKEIS